MQKQQEKQHRQSRSPTTSSTSTTTIATTASIDEKKHKKKLQNGSNSKTPSSDFTIFNILKMVSRTSSTVPSFRIFLILSLIVNQCMCHDTDNELFKATTPISAITMSPQITSTTATTIHQSSFDNKNNNNNNNINNTISISSSSSSLSENVTNNSSIIKPLFSTGNELWDNLINDCLRKATFSCFQKNIYQYFDNVLNLGDVNVTNNFMFHKNKVDYYKYTKEANSIVDPDDDDDGHADDHDHHHPDHKHNPNKDVNDEKENEIPDEEAGRSESAIEEVTNALYGRSMQFMMTHDIELKMPDIVFDGATIRVSPRSFEGNGALVKFEIIPKGLINNDVGTGRILFKKIKKFFKNKLLLSFLALVLVIKLIKIKVFWLLPLIIGVTAAKKLLLKLLLFLFPALSHLFKLCSYYHNNYHQTKFHHHKHTINHHHTVIPPWFNEPHHEHGHDASGPELIYTSPPKGHPADYLHGAPPPHSHGHHNQQNDWEFSGPGLGSEYLAVDIHRNSQVNGYGGGGGGGGDGGGGNGNGIAFQPKLDDMNEINSWGLGHTPNPSVNSYSQNLNPFKKEPSSRVINIQPPPPNNNRPSPVYTPNVGNSIQRTPPAAAAAQIVSQYNANVEQQMIKEAQRVQAQQQEALRQQAEQRIIAHQQKILQQQPFIESSQDFAQSSQDPYYSPILFKIDKLLNQLGYSNIDEPCRERLICSMYKNPMKFSPHSNFISAELSRDAIDIEHATATNAAALRFYRYVKAARDGQDQNDCLRLYTICTINTEA